MIQLYFKIFLLIRIFHKIRTWNSWNSNKYLPTIWHFCQFRYISTYSATHKKSICLFYKFKDQKAFSLRLKSRFFCSPKRIFGHQTLEFRFANTELGKNTTPSAGNPGYRWDWVIPRARGTRPSQIFGLVGCSQAEATCNERRKT